MCKCFKVLNQNMTCAINGPVCLDELTMMNRYQDSQSGKQTLCHWLVQLWHFEKFNMSAVLAHPDANGLRSSPDNLHIVFIIKESS